MDAIDPSEAPGTGTPVKVRLELSRSAPCDGDALRVGTARVDRNGGDQSNPRHAQSNRGPCRRLDLLGARQIDPLAAPLPVLSVTGEPSRPDGMRLVAETLSRVSRSFLRARYRRRRRAGAGDAIRLRLRIVRVRHCSGKCASPAAKCSIGRRRVAYTLRLRFRSERLRRSTAILVGGRLPLRDAVRRASARYAFARRALHVRFFAPLTVRRYRDRSRARVR